jgi:hypothetical protein
MEEESHLSAGKTEQESESYVDFWQNWQNHLFEVATGSGSSPPEYMKAGCWEVPVLLIGVSSVFHPWL